MAALKETGGNTKEPKTQPLPSTLLSFPVVSGQVSQPRQLTNRIRLCHSYGDQVSAGLCSLKPLGEPSLPLPAWKPQNPIPAPPPHGPSPLPAFGSLSFLTSVTGSRSHPAPA